MKILVAEDDTSLLCAIASALKDEGYEVDATEDGEECLFFAEQDIYDLLVLDILMPGMTGLEVVRTLRKAENLVPILFVTARDSISDRVAGLGIGADDYLVKPFALPELLARVAALLRRRMGSPVSHQLTCGSLVLDLVGRTAACKGDNLGLTQKEFELLEFFVANKDHILTRSQICSRLWDYDSNISFSILDVHIHNLRKKLVAHDCDQIIQTVRSVGYLFKTP